MSLFFIHNKWRRRSLRHLVGKHSSIQLIGKHGSIQLIGKHGSILLIGKTIVFYKEKEVGDGENEKTITDWNGGYDCL